MVKEFDRHRDPICHLYLEHDLPLGEVRKEMKETWGFDAQVRTYRYHLAGWGALKVMMQHPPIRSTPTQGCETCHRMRLRLLAPSPALTNWSDTGSYQTSVTSSSGRPINAVQKTRLLTPSPTPTFWSVAGSDETSATSLSILHLDNSIHAIHKTPSNLQFAASPLTGRDALPATSATASNPTQSLSDQSTLVTGSDGPSGLAQRQNVPSPGAALPSNSHSYSPSHAPSSRCRFSMVPSVDPRRCCFCGATELHYLATVSNTLDKDTLAERIKAASQATQINSCDIFRNNPGHFLAASCPTRPVIMLFHEAGVDLFKKNLAGESFLHLLDPARLGPDLPWLLQWFHAKSPGILTQRTYHGKTVLHRLLEQPYFMDRFHGLDALLNVLPIFQSVKNDINARDNQVSTAMELFAAKWLAVKKIDTASREEMDTFHAICRTFAPNLELYPDGGAKDPITFVNGMTPSECSPNGRYSGNHTLKNLELRDRELRDVIEESSHNRLAQDYCGRNGLHCLVTIHRFFPDDTVQSLVARKKKLIDLLNSDVDVNSYDCRGETPLHTLLSHVRNHDEDNTIALFTKIMVRDYGADLHLRDFNGDTALHLACKSGRLPCVEILLAMGANVNARNYRGWSAITEAHCEIVKMRENMMKNILLEGVAEIQQRQQHVEKIEKCIDLVWRAGGIDDAVQQDNLYYQDIDFTKPGLIETGCFLPRPLGKEHFHLQLHSEL